MDIKEANLNDLSTIQKFVDFWIAGRGLCVGAPGATNDYFISPSQHKRYIEKYKTWLLFKNDALVGWAVIQTDGSLIHMLISGRHRGKGLGTKFLKKLSPEKIHSKSDQQSGNPGQFYVSQGYEFIESRKPRHRVDIDKIKPNREKTIDIYQKVS